jgi:hypothetical protein
VTQLRAEVQAAQRERYNEREGGGERGREGGTDEGRSKSVCAGALHTLGRGGKIWGSGRNEGGRGGEVVLLRLHL